MKSKFIRSLGAVKKDLGQKVILSSIRGGGGIAGAFAMNSIPATLPEIVTKHKGALAFLIGTAGDVFIEQPHARAAFQGFATAGAMQEAVSFAGGELKTKLSLNGDCSISGLNAKDVDWDKLTQAAEAEALRGEEGNYSAVSSLDDGGDDSPAMLL
jgi:hypothetical protein